MNGSLLLLARRAPVAGLLLYALALPPVHAAIYTGNWDPLYGSPFTVAGGYAQDLGWRGSALFDVPSACTPTLGGYRNIDATTCGAVSLSASVQFFDVNATGTPTQEQLAWGGTSSNSPGNLSDLLFLDGVLIGFNTTAYAYVLSSLPNYQDAPLSFSLGFTFATWDASLEESYDPSTYNGPELAWLSVCDSPNDCSGGSSDNANVTDFRVSLVPEPGSAALVLLALGAALYTRRR